METPETKQKRQLSEEKLRILAANRLKGLETRKKRQEIKLAEKAEAKQKLEQEYETKVLKKKAPPPPKQVPIEETDEPVYEQPPEQTQDSEPENEPLPPQRQKAAPRAKPQPLEPNYKQEYYKYKLQSMSAKQQQEQQIQQQMQSYMQLPPYFHAVDVAKQQLKSKADDAVLKLAYSSIFPS
jgi:hypothetical protein